jgi:hypothetical protein
MFSSLGSPLLIVTTGRQAEGEIRIHAVVSQASQFPRMDIAIGASQPNLKP